MEKENTFRIIQNQGIENYGYSSGLVDEFNPAPEGADIIKGDDAVKSRLLELDKINSDFVDSVIKNQTLEADIATSKIDNTLSISQIMRMNEPELVVYANTLGIDADVDDLKSDTRNKVLAKLGHIND